MEDIRSQLEAKIKKNYEQYRERWLKMTPAELIVCCEEIEAVTRMARNFPDCVSDEDAEYLLRFKNPLEVVSEAWSSSNGIDSLIIDEELSHILWELQDRGGLDDVYELEPEQKNAMTEGMEMQI